MRSLQAVMLVLLTLRSKKYKCYAGVASIQYHDIQKHVMKPYVCKNCYIEEKGGRTDGRTNEPLTQAYLPL